MKHIYVLALFVSLGISAISYGQVILYPPVNLLANQVECSAGLTWGQPSEPGGGLPAGLLGYVIYRNGDSLTLVNGSGTLSYTDLNPGLCSPEWIYQVSALYDLAYYGSPGQTGESDLTEGDTVAISCDYPFPFQESWDQGTFAYNDWKFEPDAGNWSISLQSGNPLPAAAFSGSPALANYVFSLVSVDLPVTENVGYSDLWIEFDLKLDNVNATGTEKLSLYTRNCDEPEVLVFEAGNLTGFDWTHYKINLNDVKGSAPALLFTASGSNSSDIQQWLLDNISVYLTCRPPRDPSLTVTDSSVILKWYPPLQDKSGIPAWDLIGYQIFRADSANAPFNKITAAPVVDTNYTDVVMFPGNYQYCIKAEYGYYDCESSCSDSLVAQVLGVDNPSRATLQIRPNPCQGGCYVDVPGQATRMTLVTLTGKLIREIPVSGMEGKALFIDLSGIPSGICILKTETPERTLVSKVVIR